jgi:branched-chain amino acid transport system permease protein
VRRGVAAALWLVAVLLVLVAPALLGRFTQYLVLQVLLLALFALSFNLLFGTTGLLSFGQAAFYAAGAYTAGLLLRDGVATPLPAVLAGALVAALLAAVVGVFCVRHTHVYFSMLTLAFGMMVYAIVWKWTDVTGGDDGLIGIPRGPLSLGEVRLADLNPLPSYFRFAGLLVLASMYVLYRLSGSPLGLVLRGIRENAGRVEFAGVSVRRYVWLAFVVAGLFTGLAGALVAPLEQTVAPASAHWTKSAEPVMATLIGGPFSYAGPIVGAAVYIGLKELIVRYTPYWLLVFGTVLLVIVLTFRDGLLGALGRAARKRTAAAAGPEAPR